MVGLVAAALVVGAAASLTSQSAPAPTDAVFVRTYCVACHNDRSKTAGLSLQNLDLSDVPAHARSGRRSRARCDRARCRRRRCAIGPMGQPRRVRVVSRGDHRPRRGGASEPGPRDRASPEPRRVQQRRPRSAGASTSGRATGCRSTIPATASTTSPRCCRPRPRCSTATCRRRADSELRSQSATWWKNIEGPVMNAGSVPSRLAREITVAWVPLVQYTCAAWSIARPWTMSAGRPKRLGLRPLPSRFARSIEGAPLSAQYTKALSAATG